MPPLMTVVYKSLAWIIPLLYLLAGSIKVYPWNKELHNELLQKFETYSEVFITALLKLYTPPPKSYMAFVGAVEVSCAIALLLGPISLRLIANLVLTVIMIGACITHVQVNDIHGVLMPAVFLFGIILLLRYNFTVFLYETSNRPELSKKKRE